MDEATLNATFNGTDEDFERPLYDHLHLGFALLSTLVGIICHVIIIYLIAMMRKLHKRIYMLIMHWSIQDLLVNFFVLFNSLIFWFPGTRTLVCVNFHLQPVLLFNGTLIMAILNCNTVMKSSVTWNKILFGCVYGIFLSMAVVTIVLCKLRVHFFPIFLLPLSLHVVSLITLIVKEINKCWKRRTDPLSEETAFRMNLARIYFYNWTIFYVVGVLFFIFPEIDSWAGFLISLVFWNALYVLVYMINADKRFKIIFLNTFRKEQEYDVDATISFAEDDVNIRNT